MELSNKGATIFDKLCHTIYGAEVPKWKQGISCGKCGHELTAYYCESRLYVVECDHCGVKCLVVAKNPEQACYKTMAYQVKPVQHISEEREAVFWDSVPVCEPPIYVGTPIDCDFKKAVCGMELPCCGTDGRDLE